METADIVASRQNFTDCSKLVFRASTAAVFFSVACTRSFDTDLATSLILPVMACAPSSEALRCWSRLLSTRLTVTFSALLVSAEIELAAAFAAVQLKSQQSLQRR